MESQEARGRGKQGRNTAPQVLRGAVIGGEPSEYNEDNTAVWRFCPEKLRGLLYTEGSKIQ